MFQTAFLYAGYLRFFRFEPLPLFQQGVFEDFLFLFARIDAAGQPAVIDGNGWFVHRTGDFQGNRFVFRMDGVADKDIFRQFLRIQIGIAVAGHIEAVGEELGIDVAADAV